MDIVDTSRKSMEIDNNMKNKEDGGKTFVPNNDAKNDDLSSNISNNFTEPIIKAVKQAIREEFTKWKKQFCWRV